MGPKQEKSGPDFTKMEHLIKLFMILAFLLMITGLTGLIWSLSQLSLSH